MPGSKKILNIPLNRVEGDLEVRVEISEGVISDAWSSGTMYRGFESMMAGRGALDGLVLTPRICGICSLTHLAAAAQALDAIAGVDPPDNAKRLRNLTLMVEFVQSDIRQTMLMFLVDFANQKAYGSHPLGPAAYRRYAPLAGTSSIQAIKETKHLLEVVAIIGGQWPHTSFMVPGGVTRSLDTSDILKCQMIVEHFRSWYEQSVLGCSIQRWQSVASASDLWAWLEESQSHQEGDLGFFLRFASQAGLENMGQGYANFLSYGGFSLPLETEIQGTSGLLTAAGYAEGSEIFPFDSNLIQEDISHSWYTQPTPTAHPEHGQTRPYASGFGGGKYSWIKAPRYKDQAVETGPLAEMIIDRDPLFHDLVNAQGSNVLLRQLARLTRPAKFLPVMQAWLQELQNNQTSKSYHQVKEIPDGQGAGLIQAPRGALGHWVKIVNEKITHYQIITPSTWHGSPRDAQGWPGPWEQALIGTPVQDPANPVEPGHVIRSYDPCLVCAVHCVGRNNRILGKLNLGGSL